MSEKNDGVFPADSVLVLDLLGGVSMRAVRVLKDLGVHTVGQYRDLKDGVLEGAKNCGNVTRRELVRKLGPRNTAGGLDVPKLIPVSLRDWFAGQANEGDIKEFSDKKESSAAGSSNWYSRTAARYRFADAMLAERSK